jgi:hypothetical protein
MTTETQTTYYAVCDAGGPISVRLDAETEEQALAAFAAMDGRDAIDGQRTDAEDDRDIDGSGMDETAFAGALEAAGAKPVRDLAPVINAHAGTVAHLDGGWYLWSVTE